MNDCHRTYTLIAIVSAFIALILTYISGFFRPLLPERTVDVLLWGSPFPYMHRVVTFRGPAYVDWTVAIVDFIIWFIIVFVIAVLLWKFSGHDGAQKKGGSKQD